MGRKATIWFSETRGGGGYFTGFKGRKRLLYACKEDDRETGPNYRKAVEEFGKLVDRESEPDPKDQSFGVALERWIQKTEAQCSKSGKVARHLFGNIRERMGHLDTSDMTAKMITDYVDLRSTWGESTKAFALQRLKTCLSWNVEKGFCTFNPLAGVKCNRHHKIKSRGEEFVLPPALKSLLLAEGNPRWREFLLALSLTGARPGELYGAERKHYRRQDKVLIFHEHKTAKKIKRADKRRIIHLDDQIDDVIQRNLRSGELCFPTLTGRRWREQRAWELLDQTLNAKKVVEWMTANDHHEDRVIMYSFRHTYATESLMREVPIATLANLMGTSVKEIEDTYSHALANLPGMRQAYLKSIGKPPTQ